uniref:RAP domain-containing protein n=1 Tax=Chromera velia CCMP2878 TaxID=1169474 RepID=A0A0G4HZY7_9ALVE|eukprot:Cvel_9804.t1-p1 / transcript=Cvel_9804.t1 / gene=Cvel_9804 / organism=Chromera_velia_CCMP2878 / gene_product=hypothetical protein / transcript_product=hypothetical protein / location=Cvel_scaffold575:49392-51224(+) / protein_length=611 / sequence_SO=supercontig / SO=protein_coding / is_pseudo=false
MVPSISRRLLRVRTRSQLASPWARCLFSTSSAAARTASANKRDSVLPDADKGSEGRIKTDAVQTDHDVEEWSHLPSRVLASVTKKEAEKHQRTKQLIGRVPRLTSSKVAFAAQEAYLSGLTSLELWEAIAQRASVVSSDLSIKETAILLSSFGKRGIADRYLFKKLSENVARKIRDCDAVSLAAITGAFSRVMVPDPVLFLCLARQLMQKKKHGRGHILRLNPHGLCVIAKAFAKAASLLDRLPSSLPVSGGDGQLTSDSSSFLKRAPSGNEGEEDGSIFRPSGDGMGEGGEFDELDEEEGGGGGGSAAGWTAEGSETFRQFCVYLTGQIREKAAEMTPADLSNASHFFGRLRVFSLPPERGGGDAAVEAMRAIGLRTLSLLGGVPRDMGGGVGVSKSAVGSRPSASFSSRADEILLTDADQIGSLLLCWACVVEDIQARGQSRNVQETGEGNADSHSGSVGSSSAPSRSSGLESLEDVAFPLVSRLLRAAARSVHRKNAPPTTVKMISALAKLRRRDLRLVHVLCEDVGRKAHLLQVKHLLTVAVSLARLEIRRESLLRQIAPLIVTKGVSLAVLDHHRAKKLMSAYKYLDVPPPTLPPLLAARLTEMQN